MQQERLFEIFGLVDQQKILIRTTDTYDEIMADPLWFASVFGFVFRFSVIRVVTYHGDPTSPRTPATLYDFLVLAKRRNVRGQEVAVELLEQRRVPSEVDAWAARDAVG